MQIAVWAAYFGQFLLAAALGFAALSFVWSIWGARSQNPKLVTLAKRSLWLQSLFVTLAVLVLWSLFLTDQFIVRYVYSYSNRAMPWIYKITALWGGQEGSLLFWLWLNSLYASLAVKTHERTDRALIPYTISVLASILVFFGILLVYSDNPFRVFPSLPFDGRGLNPLLQNPSMAIHPPSLYLGYVGMSVPFAFAISALLGKNLDTRWIQASRLWTLIAWFFLSIGNLLGAQWAYVELGWGGFWGWDPVENAALMPWLTTTAFIHSVMIQEKRGMLKFWNMVLIALSFCLTLLGTYLTRSGVVQSVHSFARSNIGYFFLTYLGAVVLVAGFLIFKRRNELKSSNIFESFFSKESAFVLNNIALIGTAFIILWCTLFPTLSEALTGRRILVGPPFFNQMLAPFAIALLILTGIGPIISWRKSSGRNFNQHFLWPALVGVIVTGAFYLLDIKNPYALLTVFGAVFVSIVTIHEFVRGTEARMIQYRETWSTAVLRATFKNRRKYGGYIVHLGIVLIFIGIAGTTYKQTYEFELKPGGWAEFKNYAINFEKLEAYENQNQEEIYAIVDLYEGEQKLATLKPARFFYKAQQQPSTEVDILSRVWEDVYLTLGSIDGETQATRIHITLNPLISFLWFGGLVLILGALISMFPNLRGSGNLALRSNELPSPSETLLELRKLFHERQRLLENLQDLESDRQLEKISAQEYKQMHGELLAQASKIYETIKKIENSDPVIAKIENDLPSKEGISV